MPPSLDDAMEPLVQRRPSSPDPSAGVSSSTTVDDAAVSRPARGLFTNRLVSLGLFLTLVGVSLYFQYEMESLVKELVVDESQIASLRTIVDSQAQVIQRFNSSVTNNDVLDRLSSLEVNLNNTSVDLHHKLKVTEETISQKLNETLQQLEKSVVAAQTEIEVQVDKVKKDVESYVRKTEDQFSMENSFMVYQLAGTFTLLSGLISMWHMTAHLRKFNQPVVQRKILAILWMCPIYAITSWFSLVFPQAEGYLAVIKDFYEAYIIYQFLSFCIAVLGKGDRATVVDLLAKHANHLSPPFRCCGCCCPDPYENDRHLADAVLMQCQRFAMQFVFLRPLTSIAMVTLQKLQYYGGGDSPTDYRSPQFYITGLQNLSVFIAFTGLLKFYHAADQDLAWCRPFAKFLCIKGVVFMTFWQGLAISILASATDVGGANADAWAKSAQNFLICLEMLLFSIAHFYTFPTEEWEEGYRASHDTGKFGDSIALGDFLQDLRVVMRSTKKRRKKEPSEPTVPEEGEEDAEGDGDIHDRTSSVASALTDASSYDEGDEESGLKAILSNIDDDDPEVEQATNRLLASRLLKDSDTNWEASSPCDPIDEPQDLNEDMGVMEAVPATYGSSSVTPQGSPRQETVEEGSPPTETTGLLGSSGNHGSEESLHSENEELLRPSIFTTVSKIGEQRLNFK